MRHVGAASSPPNLAPCALPPAAEFADKERRTADALLSRDSICSSDELCSRNRSTIAEDSRKASAALLLSVDKGATCADLHAQVWRQTKHMIRKHAGYSERKPPYRLYVTNACGTDDGKEVSRSSSTRFAEKLAFRSNVAAAADADQRARQPAGRVYGRGRRARRHR